MLLYVTETLSNAFIRYRNTPKCFYTLPKHSQMLLYVTETLSNAFMRYRNTLKCFYALPKHSQIQNYNTIDNNNFISPKI